MEQKLIVNYIKQVENNLNHKNMSKLKTTIIIIISLFIVIILILDFIGIGIVDFSEEKNKENAEFEKREYPSLSNSMSLTGVIIHKKTSRFIRGSINMSLNNGTKFVISKITRNYIYHGNDYNLVSLLQVGDSISKKANSDSIFVYKNNQVYYFILDKIINEDKRDRSKESIIVY